MVRQHAELLMERVEDLYQTVTLALGLDLVYNSLNLVLLNLSIWSLVILDTILVSDFDLELLLNRDLVPILSLVFSISIWPVVILDTDLVSGVDLLHGVFIDIMVVASGLGKQKRR